MLLSISRPERYLTRNTDRTAATKSMSSCRVETTGGRSTATAATTMVPAFPSCRSVRTSSSRGSSGCLLDHAHAFRRDFLADAIAGNDGDAVCLAHSNDSVGWKAHTSHSLTMHSQSTRPQIHYPCSHWSPTMTGSSVTPLSAHEPQPRTDPAALRELTSGQQNLRG